MGVGQTATLTLVSRPLEAGHQALVFETWSANGPEISFKISDNTAVLLPTPLGCTIFGTEGIDDGYMGRDLADTPGRDVICAFGGDDFVYCRGGDDVIYGGEGRDEIIGGPATP
jgi:Ca2+-binding RTX toxin-like protein